MNRHQWAARWMRGITTAVVVQAGPYGFSQALSTSAIAKQAGPAVVLIKGTGPKGPSFGSGFLISSDGKIITALHVVENLKTISIRLPNNETYDSCTVLAYDQRRDLAIIKVAGFDLPYLELGNSNKTDQGEQVVLLGSPEGLQGTVTTGIISAIRDSQDGTFKVLQTDAAANPGNSGGPLLNRRGQVVGVLDYKLKGAENLNFAVPINYARGLLADTKTTITLAELQRRLGPEPSSSPTTKKDETTVRRVSANEVITKLSMEKLGQLVSKVVKSPILEDQTTSEYTTVRMRNLRVRIYNNGKDLSFRLSLKDKLSYQRCNGWNLATSHTYAAVEPESGGCRLDMDLHIGGGVTENTLERYVAYFDEQVEKFTNWVLDADK